MRELLIAILVSFAGSIIAYLALENPFLVGGVAVITWSVAYLLLKWTSKNMIESNPGTRPKLEKIFDKSYTNQEDAKQDIIEATERTKRLDIMLIRGHRFILDDPSLLDSMIDKARYLNNLRIILLETEVARNGYLRQLGFNEQKMTDYLSKCDTVKKKLEGLKQRCKIDYCYSEFQPTFKLIITDTCAFFAAYDRKRRGSDLPYFRCRDMGTPFFIALSTLFDEIWRRSSLNSLIE
ncbi:MAG: hypothetical protein HRF40_13530 [Nitrososphaera sp.]